MTDGMTGEHDAVGHDDVWGAPAARPPAWSTRTTLTAVAIAGALAVAGGLVIHAATGVSHDGGPGRMGGAGWAPGGPGFPGDSTRPVHSESVVPDGKGGFTTELSQTGNVTAATDTSITVRSADGYTQTFRIDPETRQPRAALHSGDEVTVRGTRAAGVNGTANATAVLPAR
ncbi:hypothetical protein [Mycolicibacterium anyangense]|nr:hypothetical protein [Mycolicibacterium anyangense]